MTENTNPTYLNVEPMKSDDLHQITHYENSGVTEKPERQGEEPTEHNTVYEKIQGNEQEITTAYEPSEGKKGQAMEYMEYEAIKVYDELQDHHHQQEHPYADLSTK